MRKGSKIIYSGNGWDMTVRELMFSIVIILIMLMGGFFISEKIASHNDEQNQNNIKPSRLMEMKNCFSMVCELMWEMRL